MLQSLQAALPGRGAQKTTRSIRAAEDAATVEVMVGKPGRRDGPAWEALPATMLPTKAGVELPVAPLASTGLVAFEGPSTLPRAVRHKADGAAAVLGPRGGSLLLAPGVRPVPGPQLPFAPCTDVGQLPAIGHWAVPEGMGCDQPLLQLLREESAQEGLRWSNIFNVEAPWAERGEDGPGRQATYASAATPLPALTEWASRLLAAIASVPAAQHLQLGTLGYIRTQQAAVQHLHRDLPLPEADSPAGKTPPNLSTRCLNSDGRWSAAGGCLNSGVA